MEQTRVEADAVGELAKEAARRVKVVEVNHGAEKCQVLAIPEADGDWEVEGIRRFLDEHLDLPRRRAGTAQLEDLDSLIAHVQRFKDEGSALFADSNPESPRLVAVFDYHEQTNEPTGDSEGPPRTGARWREHRGVYAFPLSDEWKSWMGVHEKGMSQETFAQFLEDRILDVVDPAKAGPNAREFATTLGCELVGSTALLELAKGLEVRVGQRVVNKQNLSSGEGALVFSEEHTNEKGEPLKVPRAFLLGLPVFKNGEPFQVPVRLRYRVRETNVLWSFALYRTDLIFDTAIREACSKAAEATGLPLFYGKPE